MRSLIILTLLFSFSSCFTKTRPYHGHDYYAKTWGNKPIYDATPNAKIIRYIDSALPVINPGNIYAKGNMIYQLELGRGVHVIDNTVPAQAHRVGFILINGSSQISIKDNYLYSNSYEDMVVVNISNSSTVSEVSRVPNAYPQGRYDYFYVEPQEVGYYECPQYDSVVIGWRKDSVIANCYKN